VSVVVPVKDDDRELARCLRALAEQTRPADEIVVVDNGSSDLSAAVARRAGARVLRCDSPGIAAAASMGYDAADADLILRLDADCVPASNWVQTIERAFTARPDVAVFTGGARFLDGPAALRTPLAAIYLGAYALVTGAALGHLPVFGSNTAFRAAAWRSIRFAAHRSEDLHDDLDVAFHLGELHRIRYLPGAEMGMSMRPFASRRAFVRRIGRGFRTVVLHWPHDFPPVRWLRLLMLRVLVRFPAERRTLS
jgi:glycosyltransferase involved in cell wall biosynthesis